MKLDGHLKIKLLRRKAMEGKRGPTPLHPAPPPLGGPTSSASSTRRFKEWRFLERFVDFCLTCTLRAPNRVWVCMVICFH
mmetsp:Transcript_21116/g.47348  ORF Transcript_21116/g.47348 Transcript_21116/m.47348 type:complete len:80 (-) Transcript_21116:159-398(-)